MEPHVTAGVLVATKAYQTLIRPLGPCTYDPTSQTDAA